MAGSLPVLDEWIVNYVAPSYKFTAANSKWVYRSQESDPTVSSATAVADRRYKANTFTLGLRFHPSLLWFSRMTNEGKWEGGFDSFQGTQVATILQYPAQSIYALASSNPISSPFLPSCSAKV